MTTYITQEQAELLARKHAREVYKNEGVHDAMTVPLAALPALCNAAIQHYRDSLVAGVVLPEPVACQWLQNGKMVNAFIHHPRADFDPRGYWSEKGYSHAPLYTADQVRQAIADALCVAEKETAELRLYKQNMEARFKSLNNMLADALAKQVLPEHATPQMQTAGAGVKIDMTGVDAEPGTVGWLTAARVWMTMHRAAAPDPKDAL